MKKCETVLITGATSGIGFELAKLFAQNGYNLLLVARNAAKLKTITKDFVSQYDITVNFLPKDLSIASAPQEIYQYINENNLSINCK